MANAFTSFILGVLTVLVIIAGIYIFLDYTKSEKRIANYNADNNQSDTYIYDKSDKVLENAIDESIDQNLQADPNVVAVSKATINGKLCYPSNFLPKGEIVAKETKTNKLTTIDYGGEFSTYKIEVDPGEYVLRYQAHASGNEDFLSGYYTKCAINSSADICNADDGHELIKVNVSGGDVVNNVDLCDFYYTEEPEF